MQLLPFDIASPSGNSEWNHSTVFVVELLQFENGTLFGGSTYRIGMAKNQGDPRLGEGKCQTLSDCQAFINEVERNKDNLPYVPGSFQCIDPPATSTEIMLSGCAVVRAIRTLERLHNNVDWPQALKHGSSKECFPRDSYIMQCEFAMYFNVMTADGLSFLGTVKLIISIHSQFFVRPAEIFLIAGMWKWGTILFVSSLFLWYGVVLPV